MSLDAGSLWDMAMEVAEPHVWAAQFRLLDARFIKMGKQGMDGVKLPLSMGLYRDVMSVHTARGGGGNSVDIGLEGQEVSVESGMEIDQEGEEAEEYEKQLEQAIKIFESSPTLLTVKSGEGPVRSCYSRWSFCMNITFSSFEIMYRNLCTRLNSAA